MAKCSDTRSCPVPRSGFFMRGRRRPGCRSAGWQAGSPSRCLPGWVPEKRARRDVGLVAFYLIALSLGVLLIAWRGSNVEIMRVLFGTVLAIDRGALLQIAAASSIIVLLIAALYRPLAVGAFDPAFLRSAGAPAPYGAVFSGLVVMALVASFQAFGTLLALGPMLLPAAAARCWQLGAAASIALAIGFGLAASIAGLLVSYHGNVPSGPAIVLSAGLLFAISFIAASLLRRAAPLIGWSA